MEIQKLKQTVYLPVEEGTSDMSVSYWEKDVHIADVKEIEAFVFTPEQLNEYTAKVIKDDMKCEYIIINKADIQKRIEDLENYEIMKNIWLNGNDHTVFLVKELEKILSQSTPLIPEIEKAFNAGWVNENKFPHHLEVQDYISNLNINL